MAPVSVKINTGKLDKHIRRNLMTRKDVAEASGLCLGTVAHMFNEPVKRVDIKTVKKLCSALSIAPEEILEE